MTMNCFVCGLAGRQEPALGVCVECGKAVCREHLIVQELPVYRRVAAGMGFRVEALPVRRKRMLCQECDAAGQQTHEGP